MADGVTHYYYLKLGWFLIVPVALLTYLISIAGNQPNAILYPIFMCLNFWACNFIDPDDDLISLTNSEGRILRSFKKYWLGFFGAIFVAYSFIYAYFIGLVGGHRSWASHGWVVGTIGRMIFYNIPLFIGLNFLYTYGISHFDWTKENALYNLYVDVWVKPYFVTQFVAWNIGDGIHLILDSEWAKGRLYTIKKGYNKNDV